MTSHRGANPLHKVYVNTCSVHAHILTNTFIIHVHCIYYILCPGYTLYKIFICTSSFACSARFITCRQRWSSHIPLARICVYNHKCMLGTDTAARYAGRVYTFNHYVAWAKPNIYTCDTSAGYARRCQVGIISFNNRSLCTYIYW